MTESGFHFISDYLRCQRYFNWRYIHKLIPKYPSHKLLLGQAIHTALEEWFRLDDLLCRSKEVLLISFMEAMEVLRPQYRMDESFEEDIVTGRALLDKFADDPGHRDWRPLAVEQELAFSFAQDGVVSAKLTGRLDLVVTANDGLNYIVDHKTTGWSIPMLCQSLSVSDQASAYLLLWNTAYPDRRASGVIYNILRKCKSVVEVKQHPVSRTSEDLTRFARDAEYILMEIKRKTTTPDQVFPMNTGSCFLYSNPCPYFDLCRGVNYQGLVGTVYVVEEAQAEKEIDR